MNAESLLDPWATSDDGKWVWTIEHIFPEGSNIPRAWIEMIANGDQSIAEELQKKYVHCLGNLTLTGFNSTLSNKSFIDKRDMTKDNKYIGYKNGLSLNKTLAEKETWSIDDIQERGEYLSDKVVAIFKL